MILISVVLIIISLLIAKFVLIPYSLYSKYKSPSNTHYFYPISGLFRLLAEGLKEKGDFLWYYKNLAKERQDVRIHVVNVGERINLNIQDPKLIKEFYIQENKYEKNPIAGTLKILLKTGLVFAEKNVWRSHRKTLSKVFHFEFLKQNIPMVVDTTNEFLEKLEKGNLKNVEILDEIQKITGEVVGRVFLGNNLNSYQFKGRPLTLYLGELLTDVMMADRDFKTLTLNYIGLTPKHYKDLLARIDDFRAVCLKIVQDRKNSTEKRQDLLGILLETQDNNANKEDAFSDEDIVNEFVTFFTAGMDTTANLITMVLYFLDKHPEHKKTFEAEIRDFYNQESPVNHDSLSQMEFVHAFCKEALRMNPPSPVPVTRVALEDHYLHDVFVKKGTNVRPNPIYNYYNSRYFDEPESFKPERWLVKNPNFDPYVFIPFSSGSRNCIGQHLVFIEAKIILVEFLKRFDFEVPKDYQLKMSMRFGYSPLEKVPLNLTPKK